MTYLVYENRIGFPMKLNSVCEFSDLVIAIRFAREKVKKYETEGYTVEHFNGHDWIWYAVDLTDGNDKGYLLQIFLKESNNGEIVIPNEEYDRSAI